LRDREDALGFATYRGTPIPGSTVFTTERSRKGYRINKLAMSLADPENREKFTADEAAYIAQFGLTEAERDLVRRRDWAGLLEAGGSVYVLLKLAGTVGQNLLQMGAQMRGENFEDFIKNRPFNRGEAAQRSG
jgi:protocatechuate 4,5-dioxygenase alpha subunit